MRLAGRDEPCPAVNPSFRMRSSGCWQQVSDLVFHGIAHLFRKQIVVDERLGGLRCELHHHAGGRVGVHIGILARNVVRLDVDYIEEDITRFGLAGDGTLVAILDVCLRHILALAAHELHFDGVLDGLHRHLRLPFINNVTGDLLYQILVFTFLGVQHGLADCSHDLLFVETNDAPVTLYYSLYHCNAK